MRFVVTIRLNVSPNVTSILLDSKSESLLYTKFETKLELMVTEFLMFINIIFYLIIGIISFTIF